MNLAKILTKIYNEYNKKPKHSDCCQNRLVACSVLKHTTGYGIFNMGNNPYRGFLLLLSIYRGFCFFLRCPLFLYIYTPSTRSTSYSYIYRLKFGVVFISRTKKKKKEKKFKKNQKKHYCSLCSFGLVNKSGDPLFSRSPSLS